MDVTKKIKEGDIVTFCALDNTDIRGKVLYVPGSPGDCWVIETENHIYYFQTFQYVWKVKG